MSNSLRINYIDNIKIAITFLVVAHHAGQAYGHTGGVWLVTDEPKLAFFSAFFFLNAAYMMGFFFFVSGYFMYFSVARKSTTVFLKDRFRRLGIPLLFFTFVVFLPLHYIMATPQDNYLSFIVDYYFHKPPLAVGHLWFVASLLAYTVLFLVFKKKLLQSTALVWQPWYPLLFIFLLSTVNYFVRLYFPIDFWVTWLIPIEVAHLPQYISLFFLGVIANQNQWLEHLTFKVCSVYFIVGITLFILRSAIAAVISPAIVEAFVETFVCVGIMLGSLIGFRKWANFTNPVLQYFSNCSYGIYLFHLMLVVVFQLLFKEVNLPTFLKFILVTILGIVTSSGLTYLLRKNGILRNII